MNWKTNNLKAIAMKTRVFNTILLEIIILLCGTSSYADQVKKIHKSWPIGKVFTMAVENKFGNISFINNRDDSVTIDVSVDTDMDSHTAYRIADKIDFEFSFESGKIDARTIFNESFRSNENFTINYIINIPTDKNLEVNNKYGNITLDNLNANGNFEVAYGNIMGNSLKAPDEEKIRLDLRYGNATFENVNRLMGTISYSKLRTTNIDEADLETRYSTIFAETCNEMFANSRYDNYTLLKVQRVKTDSKFTDWKIDQATLSAEFITEYGDIKIRKVPANFEKVILQNRYGNVRIGIAEDASYSLKSESFYCNVDFPDTKPMKYIKDNNHTSIEAFIGAKKTNSKVIIESHYGKVDLME